MTRLTGKPLAYCVTRGINQRAAAKRGLRVVEGKEAEALFGDLGKGRTLLGIPYYAPDGKPLLNRHAPFIRGRILGKTNGMKFLQPRETSNHFYLDPTRKDWPRILANPRVPLIETEGEFKAMAATEHGLVCLATAGVWSWRARLNGCSVPLPEHDQITWAGREVTLIYDSDLEKPQVRAALYARALYLTRLGAQVTQIFLPRADDGSKLGLDDYLVKHGAEAFTKLGRLYVSLVLDPAAPLDAAHAFLGAHYTETEGRSLIHWQGHFYRWAGTRYELASNDLKPELYQFLEGARASVKTRDGEKLVPYNPTKRRVDDVLDALKAITSLPGHLDAPCWLDRRAAAPPVAVTNGLLDLASRALQPHTLSFFNLQALNFAYAPQTPTPKRWLRFLAELWTNDRESVATLQELFGYFLSGDTKQEKLFLLVGPPRAGKGTIASVLEQLAGEDNVAWPTLSSLSERFGLQPLIGKNLALVPDARLSQRADHQALIERLLSISGRDGQTIDRKNQSPFTGRLNIRFLFISNEVPWFKDASGAMASRFIVLRLTQTFIGREDLQLRDALKAELPGILCWALDGLKRLQRRKHFLQPVSAREQAKTLADLSSPVKAFLRDDCELGPEFEVSEKDLYDAWKKFCLRLGRTYPGTLPSFARQLNAVLPELGVRRPRVQGKQIRCFTGLQPREARQRPKFNVEGEPR